MSEENNNPNPDGDGIAMDPGGEENMENNQMEGENKNQEGDEEIGEKPEDDQEEEGEEKKEGENEDENEGEKEENADGENHEVQEGEELENELGEQNTDNIDDIASQSMDKGENKEKDSENPCVSWMIEKMVNSSFLTNKFDSKMTDETKAEMLRFINEDMMHTIYIKYSKSTMQISASFSLEKIPDPTESEFNLCFFIKMILN